MIHVDTHSKFWNWRTYSPRVHWIECNKFIFNVFFFFLSFLKQSKSALSTRLWIWVDIMFLFWINAVFFKLSVCQRILCLQQWLLFRPCIQIFRYLFHFMLSAALLIDVICHFLWTFHNFTKTSRFIIYLQWFNIQSFGCIHYCRWRWCFINTMNEAASWP